MPLNSVKTSGKRRSILRRRPKRAKRNNLASLKKPSPSILVSLRRTARIHVSNICAVTSTQSNMNHLSWAQCLFRAKAAKRMPSSTVKKVQNKCSTTWKNHVDSAIVWASLNSASTPIHTAFASTAIMEITKNVWLLATICHNPLFLYRSRSPLTTMISPSFLNNEDRCAAYVANVILRGFPVSTEYMTSDIFLLMSTAILLSFASRLTFRVFPVMGSN
mmetsp:Transcript_109309/g.233599  ORF Transcript_109309/g.233599 Transcript_109309/m.233599 type:complete len:219 (+) Transcript_109309:844-1500(+)